MYVCRIITHMYNDIMNYIHNRWFCLRAFAFKQVMEMSLLRPHGAPMMAHLQLPDLSILGSDCKFHFHYYDTYIYIYI